MIVSATHDARHAATAASAALPPASRISRPAAAVAGCPAATPAWRSPAIGSKTADPGRRGRVEGAGALLPFRPTAVSAVRALPSRRAGTSGDVNTEEESLSLTKEAKIGR